MAGPQFISLLSSGIDAPAKAVTFSLLASDNKQYDMQIVVGCVGAFIGALAAETRKLLAVLPTGESYPIQGIRVDGTQLAMKDDGTVSLLLKFESGVELPLEFRDSDLAKLRAQIDEAVQMADRQGRH